jgi:hypothetical protein
LNILRKHGRVKEEKLIDSIEAGGVAASLGRACLTDTNLFI